MIRFIPLFAAATLMLAAGAAQAHCPPAADPPSNDLNFAGCALAAGFDKENQGKYLALLANRLTPEEATMLSAGIDPALYGGLPDAADPSEVRRQRERGEREEAAHNNAVTVSIQVAKR